MAFDAHVHEMQALIHKPWMLKIKAKPQLKTAVWSATSDSAAKRKLKVSEKALSADEKAADCLAKRH